jgi:hypothetical protein
MLDESLDGVAEMIRKRLLKKLAQDTPDARDFALMCLQLFIKGDRLVELFTDIKIRF